MERAAISLDRIRHGRAARSMILYGLRGVGKTVLLNRIRLDCEAEGFATVRMEAPEERSLPALLAPALRVTLLRLSKGEAMKDKGRRALQALAGFAKSLKAKFGDIEFSLDVDVERGLADSGDLDFDLSDLLVAVGEAAAERNTAVVLFLDELQYVAERELASLIGALHNATQLQLPITMVAAGLPQLLGRAGKAKSYAERLFEFVPVDRLDNRPASDALCKPAEREGVQYEAEAIAEILEQTHGYPYFLQEWGKHCWSVANGSPITSADSRQATRQALAELDASFFRVRFDRLTPLEKSYMRAMADLGPGPHRSGDIAERLGRRVVSIAQARNSLISKGMLFSPAHGDTAFTVPMFDEFLKRIMPQFTP